MRCTCGNEQGKPRINPYPVTIVDSKTKKEVELLYMAGHMPDGTCWFCAVDVAGV